MWFQNRRAKFRKREKTTSHGMLRENSPPVSLLNGSLCTPYSIGQCSPPDLSAVRSSSHHPHAGTPPHSLGHSAGPVGAHFSPHGFGGLNEFLWSAAGLGGGLPHGAPGLFSTPSLFSAFPALAAAGWSPKSAAAPSAASIFAQYMMASNPPVFPYDLSAKSGNSVGDRLSPSDRSRRSDSLSPPSHSSAEFNNTSRERNLDVEGKTSPSLEDEAIDLVKTPPRLMTTENGNSEGGYGITFHGKLNSGSKQESISMLRERAAKHVANGIGSAVKN